MEHEMFECMSALLSPLLLFNGPMFCVEMPQFSVELKALRPFCSLIEN